MPRCYMVKKDPSPLGGTPPCSPTEASVAPPCYSPQQHHTDAGPRAAQLAEAGRHVGTQYEEPRSGDAAEQGGGGSPARNGLYTVLRAAQYADAWRAASPCPPHAEPDDALSCEPAAAYDPPDKDAQYAELQSMAGGVRERSAADTEAAHELLSLAAGVPPLPPATVLTVLGAPDPVLPVYTYALQPTSIYIIADEPGANNLYATTVQTLAPLQQVEYAAQPQVSTYIIQDSGAQYQPLVCAGEVAEAGVPVSVIEAAPPAEPLSVQVPVIEPVPGAEPAPPAAPEPLSAPEPTEDTDSDESAPLCNNAKKNKYNCNECGKRYATSSNLSRHKQTHRSLDSQAAKRCGECGKAYVSMPALAMHVLTHRMGYVCGVCGKQFSRPWLLRGHLRSHTGEKPYNCPSCSKSFADRSNLRAHLQTHTADKRWECSRCNKSFALKSYLNKHQEAACAPDDHEPH